MDHLKVEVDWVASQADEATLSEELVSLKKGRSLRNTYEGVTRAANGLLGARIASNTKDIERATAYFIQALGHPIFLPVGSHSRPMSPSIGPRTIPRSPPN
jgi:hypothetical protein